MADIKQKAVHSNGYTANWRYTDWGDWSRSSYTARSSWPYTADWGYDSGGYYYTDYGQYYRNRNYWENTNDGVVNTVNYSPKLANGSALLTSSQYGTATITIDLSKLTYTDTESNAATKWRIFKAFSSNGTSFGAWTQLAEISTKSYTWTVTSETAGYYKIAVTVYDGYSWSAILENGTFKAHHIENGNVNTNTYDTVSYAESSVFKIVHYMPPTWLTDYYTVAQMNQLKEEVNKARTSFGLSSYTFTTASIVADFTLIKANDIKELQTAANDVYKSARGSDYVFTDAIDSSDVNKTKIVSQNLKDIQNLLDNLVDGGGSSSTPTPPTETWVTKTGNLVSMTSNSTPSPFTCGGNCSEGSLVEIWNSAGGSCSQLNSTFNSWLKFGKEIKVKKIVLKSTYWSIGQWDGAATIYIYNADGSTTPLHTGVSIGANSEATFTTANPVSAYGILITSPGGGGLQYAKITEWQEKA